MLIKGKVHCKDGTFVIFCCQATNYWICSKYRCTFQFHDRKRKSCLADAISFPAEAPPIRKVLTLKSWKWTRLRHRRGPLTCITRDVTAILCPMTMKQNLELLLRLVNTHYQKYSTITTPYPELLTPKIGRRMRICNSDSFYFTRDLRLYNSGEIIS